MKNTLVPSTFCKAYVKAKEQLRLKAYKPTPQDVWTIGWGHTGKDVYEGLVITEAHAEELLDHDLAMAAGFVNSVVKILLKQCQLDALTALTMNVGTGGLLRSRLLKAINSNDIVSAAKEWLTWDHQGAIELGGLKIRRTEEWGMFTA